MQYTLRNISPALDSLLRGRAQAEAKSLNQVALEALSRGLGLQADQPQLRDLGDLAGTWQDDPDFDAAVADQQRIDPDLWPPSAVSPAKP